MVRAPARVLVVEDDSTLSDALEIAFRSEGYEVCAAGSADEAERAAPTFVPDLAVLDVRLPGGTEGVTLARRLRSATDVPVIFLTAATDVKDRLAGFDAGADDYVAKPFDMGELLARVRALLRRSGRMGVTVHQVGSLVIDEAAHLVVWANAVVDLTPIEFGLLCVLARRPGQVMSKRGLMEEVWGFDAFDPNLVEVHVSSLRKKLEEHGPRVIHTVRGVGYVLRS